MSEPQWYINVKGKQQGPFPLARLKKAVESGGLPDGTMVRRDGWQTWRPWQEIPILSGHSPSVHEVASVADAVQVEFAQFTPSHAAAGGTAVKLAEGQVQAHAPTPGTDAPHAKPISQTKNSFLSLADMTPMDLALRVLGLLLAISGILWFGMMIVQGYGHRFKDDNAIGATANAVEAIQIGLTMWLHVFAGLALYAYSSLRRIRRRVLERL